MKKGDLLNVFATGTERRKVVVVINPELGYDNIICIAESIKAAKFYLDKWGGPENTLDQMVRDGYILRYLTLQTQIEE